MIDALSPLEMTRVWLTLREQESPEADHYRQELLERLRVEPRPVTLKVYAEVWNRCVAGRPSFWEEVPEDVQEIVGAALDAWNEGLPDD